MHLHALREQVAGRLIIGFFGNREYGDAMNGFAVLLDNDRVSDDNKTQVITIEMQKILDKMADEEKRILLVRADERDALVQQGYFSINGTIITLTRDALLQIDRLLHGFFLTKHANARYA